MIPRLCKVLLVSLPLHGCALFEDPEPEPETLIDSNPLPESRQEQPADTLPNWLLDPNLLIDADRGPEDLWERLRDGLRLQDEEHERIDEYREWYASHPRYMERVSTRAARYLYAIVEKLEERDIPTELALLPVVESAFDPFAYSHGRASGLWQFIPSTGRHFDLKQNWWYDGRRDVEASTEAALDYLKALHGQFDDWLLALAAYNTGQGNLRRSMRRNRSAGKPTDFWSLSLPGETRAYVPQLLALSQVIAEPDQYDVSLSPIPNEPYYDVIDIDSQIDLAKAAELADMEIEDLYLLNPGFNRWATDPEGPHRLLIPMESTKTFMENLEEHPPEERVAWASYEVKRGDNLAVIASRFNTTVDMLQEANEISDSLIRAGQQLLIPTAANSEDYYSLSASQRLAEVQSSAQGQGQKVSHTVQQGDSFWEIAQRYGVSVRQVASWNGMAPKDALRVGQSLVVWTDKQTTGNDDREVTREVSYQVRQGDSLAGIAQRFNLSVSDIAAWNSMRPQEYIHPGQTLKLIVDVTNSR